MVAQPGGGPALRVGCRISEHLVKQAGDEVIGAMVSLLAKTGQLVSGVEDGNDAALVSERW